VKLISTAGHDILGNFEHSFTFRTAAESSDDKRGGNLQIIQSSARPNGQQGFDRNIKDFLIGRYFTRDNKAPFIAWDVPDVL